MSETSNGDGAAGSLNDLDLPQNKKDSEKNRREQENLCIEELAMLISAQIPELSDSDDSSSTTDASRLEKGSILQDTVDKLKSLRAQMKVRLVNMLMMSMRIAMLLKLVTMTVDYTSLGAGHSAGRNLVLAVCSPQRDTWLARP